MLSSSSTSRYIINSSYGFIKNTIKNNHIPQILPLSSSAIVSSSSSTLSFSSSNYRSYSSSIIHDRDSSIGNNLHGHSLGWSPVQSLTPSTMGNMHATTILSVRKNGIVVRTNTIL